MKKYERKDTAQKGSMMVEALAMLGLITMVTPVLYKKAAERTTELQDINVATQMRMISSAVDDFIKDNYKEVGEAHGGETFEITGADLEKLNEYLPYGFDTQKSRLFEDFNIRVHRRTVEDKKGKEHHIYTTAVLAPLSEDIPMMRSSKIASMIGVNGGVYRGGMLEGVQGTWRADPSDYGFSIEEDVKDGSLVVVSNEAISSAQGDVSSDEVLYRIDDGDEAKNTMQTTLYMGGNDLRGLEHLIAQGDTVSIGKEGNKESNLLVTGTTNLKNALTVEGDTRLENKLTVEGDTELVKGSGNGGNLSVAGNTKLAGTLTVEGDTSLKNTTITGNLTQSGGSMDLKPTAFTLASSGDASITGTTVKVYSGSNSVIVNNSGVAVAGTTASVKSGANGLTVDSSGSKIDGNLTIDGKLSANEVEGKQSIMAGEDGAYFIASEDGAIVKRGALMVGGNDANSSNLYADASTVEIAENSFVVGGDQVGAVGSKISIGDDHAFIGNSYATNENHKGLMVTASNLVLRNDYGSLSMEQEDGVVLSNADARVKLDDDSVVIGVGTENAEDAKIVAQKSKVGFENKGGDTDNSIPYSLYLEDGVLNTATKGMVSDERGIALGVGDISTLESMDVDAPSTLDNFLLGSGVSGEEGANERKVAISRQGIIELRAPTAEDNDGGYIRARRLVSDVKYPWDETGFTGVSTEYQVDGKSSPNKPYDYYQVNPAYTSVMNDIKLASRGGARLSDILPDFINRGIYVVDNTYAHYPSDPEGKDSVNSNTGTLNWKDITRTKVKDQVPCKNNNCIASPWMGFVPAPQCPKNYAKVITLNPIRWRMSEVYSVYGSDTWGDKGSEDHTYYDIYGGPAFKKYFLRQTDPKMAGFVLSTAGGEEHTHTIESGYPLTYQTNTWLNTTIDDVSTAEGDFQGWHAIMGFVYRPTQYREVLEKLGITPDNSKIYWNVFPVYAQEMAAVANVYCFFERNTAASGKTPIETDWQWGKTVDHYDQLNNFRAGYEKDPAWAAQVNDPELGYDDAW